MTTPPRSSGWDIRLLSILITITALAMIAYHVMIVQHPVFGELMNQNVHLGFALVLVMLHLARWAGRWWWRVAYVIGALLSLFLVVYMAVEYERLDMYAGFPEFRDVLVGVALITLVIALTWRTFGAIFPALVLAGIAYALWGHHLPGIMGHPPLKLDFVVSNLSVGFQGIYGMLLSVSVNVIFLLVIFGSIFGATGVTQFFMTFGTLLSRHLRGGAGQTAVFSSSFVGMVNGVAAANVAITGAYTIPVMKKSGFSGEQAAAIEAMASTGGQLTPPIMGIAVFIMANFLGISYAQLMSKALVPALAYYAIAVLGVMLIASRRGIPLSTAAVDWAVLRRGAPVFLLPMAVLTGMLFMHHTVGKAAVWSIITLLVVSCARRATRPAWRDLLQQLEGGAVLAATFAVATACIGILVKCMTFTGLATKLSMVITAVAGQSLLPTLIMVMVLSIFLSASTPTVIAYVVVAFLAAPVLTELGVDQTVAHFFVFYYAVLATVTPPVAGAAMVGSQIARADYLQSAWESFKLVGPFYILPFFMVRNPVILLEAQPLNQAVMALGGLAVAMFGIMCLAQRFCLVKLGGKDAAIVAVAVIAATIGGFYHSPAAIVFSVIVAVGFLTVQVRKRSRSVIRPHFTGAVPSSNTPS